MKRPLSIVAVLSMFIAGGCNDFAIKTSINPDGSFERTVVCNGDSLGLSKLHLPYVFDSTWSIVTKRKKDGARDFLTTAMKEYSNTAQLLDEFSRGKDSSKLWITCRVEKRFRWFFTYYFYSETLASYSIYRHEPVDSFFTPIEIELIKENRDSLLGKRVEELWDRNVVDEFVERIQVKTKELNDPELPPSAMSECKAALTKGILNGKDDKAEDIKRVVEKALQPRPAKKLRGAIDTIFSAMTAELEREAELDISYKNEVTMPGILMTSNSRKIEGNKVMWDCRSNKYFDTAMSAESRRVNLWAVIVTALVCVGLVVALLLPVFYRPKDAMV